MKNFISIRKWPFLLLTGSLLLVTSSDAWAWPTFRSHHRGRAYISYRTYGPEPYCDPYSLRSARVIQVVPDETTVINIPNDNGSYTPVTLRRSGGNYVGPRGEYYINMPTVEQLKAIYGLQK